MEFNHLAQAIRNRGYTGKTHKGGFQTLNFLLVRVAAFMQCATGNSIRPGFKLTL